jgi:queuine tRNA-ribosyltransferase
MSDPISFTIEKKLPNSLARAGVIHTLHGDIQTPAFVTVGTKGSIKGVLPEDMLRYVGNQVALANTYHLFLQPGPEVIKAAGGLHAYANWQLPTMTDSGGFQVFSLGAAFGKGVTKFAKSEVSEDAETQRNSLNVYSKETASEQGRLCIVDDEGVTFTSHIDGSMHRFTAERSIEIQQHIGADIIVAFDECTSPTAEYDYQKEAMDRTHRWAKRSIMAHKQNYEALKKQGLYGVVQGGRYTDLRQESARTLAAMDFAGFGIGGSFSKEDLGESLRVVNEILPENKPRHLLGIGEPEDIVQGVLQGCDTFDCVAATRIGRTGTIYVATGKTLTSPCGKLTYPETKKLNLLNERFGNDHSRLDPLSTGYMATTYSKAYVSHLFRAKEMLGPQIASIHNLHYIVNFTKQLREQLLQK